MVSMSAMIGIRTGGAGRKTVCIHFVPAKENIFGCRHPCASERIFSVDAGIHFAQRIRGVLVIGLNPHYFKLVRYGAISVDYFSI